jgi:acyl-CoA synthetase (AMP-forming)/AMP-acid ligase II
MDSKWGEIVAASVVLISDSVELTYDELKSFLEGKISKFKIPKKIFFEKRTFQNRIRKS